MNLLSLVSIVNLEASDLPYSLSGYIGFFVTSPLITTWALSNINVPGALPFYSGLTCSILNRSEGCRFTTMSSNLSFSFVTFYTYLFVTFTVEGLFYFLLALAILFCSLSSAAISWRLRSSWAVILSSLVMFKELGGWLACLRIGGLIAYTWS